MDYKYDISIIVPAYNVEEYIDACMESLLAQTYDFSKIEVVAIDDGSSDGSYEALKKYASEHSNVKVLTQENQGLSKTRNRGLDEAEGKYIAFLDPDDTLTPESIENLVTFFDLHYDEIDLLEYKIIRVRNGKKLPLHYRYTYLTKTGIYDLNKKDNWYACITTINYCIKNTEEKVYFDITPGFMHEDQKFSMDIIKKKLKIGYCEEACYLYLQRVDSVTKTKFHAYYLFDTTMNFWETFLGQYEEKVPEYFQALLLNDLSWKFRTGILLPYHFEGEEYEQQFKRIKKLVSCIDEEVLCNHPSVDKYHRQYFLSFKDSYDCKVYSTKNGVALLNNDKLVFADFKIDIPVHKMRIEEDRLYIQAYLKSPIFMHCEMPKLFVVINNIWGEKKQIELRDSSYSYYNSKEKCAQAYLFETDISLENVNRIKFYVEVKEEWVEGKFMFPLMNIFSDDLKRYDYYRKPYLLKYNQHDNSFSLLKDNKNKVIKKEKKMMKIHNFFLYLTNAPKKLAMRWLVVHYKPKKNIWLYYDCKGVKKDNAYYQFIHDMNKKDGIRRYYVTNNTDEFNKEVFGNETKGFLKFNSFKHKFLYLKANKIITAFIEYENCLPYSKKTYTQYLDVCEIPEVIYLQHGVLHAHMPWKYSLDRLPLDKEVVSTGFEVENLKRNYCFTDAHIIPAGMPRYDFINNKVESKNKILYAPSWRSYLVGPQSTDYAENKELFLESEFYKESNAFLSSNELANMLEKNNYILNFKLHPIMKKYEYLYDIKTPRIKVGEDYPDSDYKIFITDFSSYVYDFVYLKRAIIYFVPDYIKFKAGMNLYREVDLKFEDGVGTFCQTHKEILSEMQELLTHSGEAKRYYWEKMDKFFLHDDNEQRERIYQALISKTRNS